MKKITSILFILLLLPTILAVNIELSKENYHPGELLQAEITGNFISLKPENILIYKGEKVHPTPTLSDVTFRTNKYYFYSSAPLTEGDYSLRIEDAEYISAGEIKTEPIIKEFTIQKTNTSALSIYPGFVLTSEDFEIKIKSLQGDIDVTATLEATGETKSISLIEDSEETLDFSIEGITNSTEILIEGYSIPVFSIAGPQEITPTPIENITKLDFIPMTLSGNITAGHIFKIVLKNSGDIDISDIELKTDSGIILNPSKVDFLEPEENIEITVIMPEDLEDDEKFSGAISAFFNKQEIQLPFLFEITSDERKVDIKTEAEATLSCFDIGVICLENQECKGELTLSTEGLCCLGICVEKKQSSLGLWIGILLILIVLGVIAFFYIKSRKKLKLKSSEEILKEKQKKYSERMQKLEKPKEISGGLGKV